MKLTNKEVTKILTSLGSDDMLLCAKENYITKSQEVAAENLGLTLAIFKRTLKKAGKLLLENTSELKTKLDKNIAIVKLTDYVPLYAAKVLKKYILRNYVDYVVYNKIYIVNKRFYGDRNSKHYRIRPKDITNDEPITIKLLSEEMRTSEEEVLLLLKWIYPQKVSVIDDMFIAESGVLAYHIDGIIKVFNPLSIDSLYEIMRKSELIRKLCIKAKINNTESLKLYLKNRSKQYAAGPLQEFYMRIRDIGSCLDMPKVTEELYDKIVENSVEITKQVDVCGLHLEYIHIKLDITEKDITLAALKEILLMSRKFSFRYDWHAVLVEDIEKGIEYHNNVHVVEKVLLSAEAPLCLEEINETLYKQYCRTIQDNTLRTLLHRRNDIHIISRPKKIDNRKCSINHYFIEHEGLSIEEAKQKETKKVKITIECQREKKEKGEVFFPKITDPEILQSRKKLIERCRAEKSRLSKFAETTSDLAVKLRYYGYHDSIDEIDENVKKAVKKRRILDRYIRELSIEDENTSVKLKELSSFIEESNMHHALKVTPDELKTVTYERKIISDRIVDAYTTGLERKRIASLFNNKDEINEYFTETEQYIIICRFTLRDMSSHDIERWVDVTSGAVQYLLGTKIPQVLKDIEAMNQMLIKSVEVSDEKEEKTEPLWKSLFSWIK